MNPSPPKETLGPSAISSPPWASELTRFFGVGLARFFPPCVLSSDVNIPYTDISMQDTTLCETIVTWQKPQASGTAPTKDKTITPIRAALNAKMNSSSAAQPHNGRPVSCSVRRCKTASSCSATSCPRRRLVETGSLFGNRTSPPAMKVATAGIPGARS